MRNVKRTIDRSGRITVELAPGITVSRPSNFSGIDPQIVARARAATTKNSSEAIVAVKAGPDTRDITGVLRECLRTANPLKIYKGYDTSMAYAMLGPIGAQPVGKITVHVMSSPEEQWLSFTSWIPSELLEEHRIVCGITVSMQIEGVHLPGGRYEWFCNYFRVAGWD